MMMKMMMVKRSVVTSHKAEGQLSSMLSPFVTVFKCCFVSLCHCHCLNVCCSCYFVFLSSEFTVDLSFTNSDEGLLFTGLTEFCLKVYTPDLALLSKNNIILTMDG